MKKLILPVFAAASMFMVSCGESETVADVLDNVEDVVTEPIMATYNVDTEASSLSWTGYEAADEAGHFHTGAVPFSGTVETTDGAITGGVMTIDLANMSYSKGVSHGNSMTSTDTAAYQGLFDHFNDTLLLDLANNPTATLTLIGYNKENDCIDATLNLKGMDLTIAIPYGANVSDTEVTYVNSFDLDLGAAVPFLAIPAAVEGEEPMTSAPMAVKFKLDLKATK